MNVDRMISGSGARRATNMFFAAAAVASLADQGRKAHEQQRSQAGISMAPVRNNQNNYNPALAGVNNRKLRRILGTEDFFEMLDLGESATSDEVKEAYLELATEFHPGKSTEVGAREAFRKLAQAYDCLFDDEKRGIYLKCCQRDKLHPERLYRQYYNDDDILPDEVYLSASGEKSEIGYSMNSFNVARNHGVVKVNLWGTLYRLRFVGLIILAVLLLIFLVYRSNSRY